MKRQIFKSKIHRATVTGADLDYEGSITIDSALMKAADILPYEAVHVWNITNGSRIITYAIEGKKDSGEICINGAGAKLNKIGDLIIIATFAEMTSKKAREWKPLVISVNKKNGIVFNVKASLATATDLLSEASLSRSQVVNRGSNYLHRPIGTNSTGLG
jgi:aspartate 1-decarboxylase